MKNCKHLLGCVTVFCAMVAVAPATRCFAEDLKTLDGKTFQNISIAGMDAGRVKIVHDAGLIWIEKASLPPEFVTKHNIPAVDPVKFAAEQAAADAKRKEMIAAGQAQAKAEADMKAKMAAAARIRGRVLQVVGEGLMVKAGGGGGGVVASSLASVGGGGGVYAPSTPDPFGKGRPKEVEGTFFLVGHPKLDSLVDGNGIDVDAIPVGVFDFTNVEGAPTRVKKYEVLKAFK